MVGQRGGHRWAVVARAWLTSTRAAHLVGSRVGDSPANALGPDAQWPAIRGIRREVLAELAMLEPGTAADRTRSASGSAGGALCDLRARCPWPSRESFARPSGSG